MPELDGLGVAGALSAAPVLVFVTADDEHALAAFELAAVDYLVSRASIAEVMPLHGAPLLRVKPNLAGEYFRMVIDPPAFGIRTGPAAPCPSMGRPEHCSAAFRL